jgi:hypothetical protein
LKGYYCGYFCFLAKRGAWGYYLAWTNEICSQAQVDWVFVTEGLPGVDQRDLQLRADRLGLRYRWSRPLNRSRASGR